MGFDDNLIEMDFEKSNLMFRLNIKGGRYYGQFSGI